MRDRSEQEFQASFEGANTSRKDLCLMEAKLKHTLSSHGSLAKRLEESRWKLKMAEVSLGEGPATGNGAGSAKCLHQCFKFATPNDPLLPGLTDALNVIGGILFQQSPDCHLPFVILKALLGAGKIFTHYTVRA